MFPRTICTYFSRSKNFCFYFPHLKARKITPQKIFEFGKHCSYCTLHRAITSTYSFYLIYGKIESKDKTLNDFANI